MRRRRREHREPAPPVDIRIHLHDGTTIPAEAVYIGDDPAGNHEWLIVTIVADITEVQHVSIGELPANTSVMLRARHL